MDFAKYKEQHAQLSTQKLHFYMYVHTGKYYCLSMMELDFSGGCRDL